ncbi:hypothetical protein EER27_04795 [Lysobacter psychrotolerans]|uniref:DUF4148 domain-containing protein n=2 Tax=Montanilutibacter psychrotolerans TaxID=1327343 RepID=A0A3M8T2W4_9GAMM|nr:hypothetical protein EER27_04795 [Lysobacter psychrotolerans]
MTAKSALLVFILLASGCGASSNELDLNSAKAQAERKAAAEHFGNSQYADVKPFGAEEEQKDKDAGAKRDEGESK